MKPSMRIKVGEEKANLARFHPLYSSALSQHSAGQVLQAQSLYDQLLLIFPNDAEIIHLSGLAALQLDQYAKSIELISKAIDLKADFPEAYNNRGNAYRGISKYKDAAEDYSTAIFLRPDYAMAHNNLAVTLRDMGKLHEALAEHDAALSLKPHYREALIKRGTLLIELEKFEDALTDFNKVLLLYPNDLDVLHNRGIALMKTGQLKKALSDYNQFLEFNPSNKGGYNNRGNIFLELGLYHEALLDFNRALELDPDYAEALNHRGVAFKELKRFDEALEDYNKALTLKPDYADALNNRGVVYREFGRLHEALADYSRAIELVPDYAEVYNNRAGVFIDLKQFDEALADFDKATALKPDYAGAYWNKSLYWLLLGDFKTGWPLYEWRWRSEKHIGEPITTSKPLWNNQNSKNVLLWAEQGIGDEIMFASLIPELHAKCDKLIVQCDPRLIPLFKRSFPQDIEFYDKNDLVSESLYEFHIPMGSLAPILRPSIESFTKGAKPYLFCQKEQALELRERITGHKDDTLIGISWSSKSTIPAARQRNIPLTDIARLLNKPDTTLVSLQYGDVSNEIADLKKHHNIDVIEVSDIDIYNDLDSLSALISACDHVVSIDNATVHMAGALGADTHVLLPTNQDWRWGLESSQSYWYETLKLYRQEKMGEWNQTLKNLEMKLTS